MVFTGIATYYDAATASDQLDQAREDARSQSREQAEHVWYWTERRGPMLTDGYIHVVNRSADPVSGVVVGLGVIDLPDVVLNLPVLDLGPCTELIYRPVNMASWTGRLDDMYSGIRYMRFTDRAGLAWERRDTRLVRTAKSHDYQRMDQVMLLKDPQEKTAHPCDQS
ncbi:hypothetical protein [Streptomyces canus]|uniref:hypothetical protein n=1 Tax=Streptomyces canus TaxID=58343 RepID=UPI002E2A0ABB|nr:hypothetical protein [Streptomyces canus]